MVRQHRIFPAQRAGYELSPKYGWFSILEPAAMTNLCTNPSFELGELNPSGFTHFNKTPAGATATIVSTQQRRGSYSLEITPPAGDTAEVGMLYSIETDGTAVLFTLGFDFLGVAGHTYRVFGLRSDSSRVGSYTFVASGSWERKHITFYKEPAPPSIASVYCVRETPINDVQPFYFDGFCLTRSENTTTYFDGSSLAFGKDSNYAWVGGIHDSTSVRDESELSSGIIRNLKDYGYDVLSFIGLGLHPQNNTILENALLGGGSYQRGRDQIREYSIIGSIAKTSLASMLKSKASIEELLRYGHTLQQPIVVRSEFIDDDGSILSQPSHMRSIYKGGFEGTVNNLYQERSSLQFDMDRTKILEDGEEGGSLNTYESITSLLNSARRTPSGGWDDWDSGANGAIYSLKFDKKRGRVYAGGNFTQIGSAPLAAARFAYWDVETETWVSLFGGGAGINGIVYDIQIAGNGDPWVCGTFTTVNGVASRGIAYYDIDSAIWNPLTAAIPAGHVNSMVFSQNGTDLYIGGFDSGANGGCVYHVDTITGVFTDWTPASKTIPGGSQVLSVELDASELLWAAGDFTQINATNANYIATCNGVIWLPIGNGLTIAGGGHCDSLEFGDDGLMYMAGVFDDADGVDVNNIASYGGESFSPLGGGIDATVTYVNRLKYHKGTLYTGVETSVPDMPTILRYAAWNGTNWLHPDIKPNAVVRATEFDNVGNQYIGDNFTSAVVSEYATLTNTGSASAEPVIVVRGELVTPAAHTWDDTILWIKNETTNQTIYLNLPISEFEIITFDLRRGRKRIISDTRGDVTNFVLPSSDFASFNVAPGENLISVFVDSAELVSNIYWQISHDYIGGSFL
jgi:hypothetical protein